MKPRNGCNRVKESHPKDKKAALALRMQEAMSRVIDEDQHRFRVSFQFQQGYVTNMGLVTLLWYSC